MKKPANRLSRIFAGIALVLLSTGIHAQTKGKYPQTTWEPGFAASFNLATTFTSGVSATTPAIDPTIELETASLAFQYKPAASADIKIKLDFLSLKNGLLRADVLEDVVLRLKLADLVDLRIGQFEFPFAPDGYLSKKDRPWIHSSSTIDAIAPGRDRGLLAEGRMNGALGYQLDHLIRSRLDIAWSLGVFAGNGIKSTTSTSSVNALVTLQGEWKLDKRLTIEPDFALSGGFDFSSRMATLRQAFGVTLEWKNAGNQRLFFIAQYADLIQDALVLNFTPANARSIFSCIAYRWNSLEAYATIDSSITEWQSAIGMSLYSLESDILKNTMAVRLDDKNRLAISFITSIFP